jgi:hypothetical protein
MRRFALTMTFAGASLLLLATAPLEAQAWGRGDGGVPPGHRPPAGMCRIWIDGVPPGQQPAPTDCATALRNRPSNGRVIFGDDAGGRGKGKGGARSRSDGARGNGDYDDDRDRGDDRADDRNGRTTTTGGGTTGGGVWGDIRRRLPSNACVDRNRDGYCDSDNFTSGSAGTASLPDMVAGTLFARGQRTADVSRWLGGGQLSARPLDVDRNGVPARVMWYDQAGQLVQVWTDRNGDGRADRVEIFQNGRRVRVVGE